MKEFEKEVPQNLIDEIIFLFYKIHHDLGYGFLERVYQNALYVALTDGKIKCEVEKPIKVYHNGRVVGDYRTDLVVEDCIILELKACEELNPAHEAQLLNYLKATDIEVGYILNFGKRAKFSRKVYSNKKLINQKIKFTFNSRNLRN
jgi:GxxExxY protein